MLNTHLRAKYASSVRRILHIVCNPRRTPTFRLHHKIVFLLGRESMIRVFCSLSSYSYFPRGVQAVAVHRLHHRNTWAVKTCAGGLPIRLFLTFEECWTLHRAMAATRSHGIAMHEVGPMKLWNNLSFRSFQTTQYLWLWRKVVGRGFILGITNRFSAAFSSRA
jgi:hypothetical protein